MRISPQLGLAVGLALVAPVLTVTAPASAQVTGCKPGQHQPPFKPKDNSVQAEFTYWNSTKCGTGRARISGWINDILDDDRAARLTVHYSSGLTTRDAKVLDSNGAKNSRKDFNFELPTGFNGNSVCIQSVGDWRPDGKKTCVNVA